MKTFVALVCCLALHAQAETFSAKVIVVMDGDTVMVLRDGAKIKIRLANIDAPEKDQPFGKQARDSLQELIGKKQIQVDSQAVDKYGRTVGLIMADGLDVNQEQVRRGMAWAAVGWRQSRRTPVPLAGAYSHSRTDKNYIDLQNDAKRARRGLWAQSNPQAPWQWRKLHPSAKTVAPTGLHSARHQAIPVMVYDVECGKKTRCSQMHSCDEARFYFTLCGVATLDRNHDGIPCQDLCGK
jgi:micrococcal nuclease